MNSRDRRKKAKKKALLRLPFKQRIGDHFSEHLDNVKESRKIEDRQRAAERES